MDTFLQELCTRRALTVPYTPQQNPAAERMWGILLRKARTSMCECNADDRLWPYFIKQAALIHGKLAACTHCLRTLSAETNQLVTALS